ncbi:ABC transporter substrate-binding protein [Malaciobacter sp. WC5094]
MTHIFKIIFVFLFILNFLYSNEIKIGMTADMTGSISYLGKNMKKGIEAYLNIHNKYYYKKNSKNKYKLIVYDDMYNPILASRYVKRLIHEDKVLAILGSVGTPTANVILPVIKKYKTPFVGAYSGGNILRNSKNDYVFNFRASYTQEAYVITKKLLLEGLKLKDIAVFTQNDTYGDSGYHGVLKAIMENNNLSILDIAHERYTKGTENIEIGLSKLLDYNRDFKAIIIVGVNKSTVKFIKYAKEDFKLAKFFLLSPIDSKVVVNELNSFKNDIYTSQVLPPLSDLKNKKLIDEFKSAYIKKFNTDDYNIISFEGYLVAKLFVNTLELQNNLNINKKEIYKALKNLRNMDIGLNFKSDFNNSESQYSNKVWLCKIDENNNLVSIPDTDIFRK